MGGDNNKALVRRFIESAFNEGDLAIIDELVASDYVLHDCPRDPWPRGDETVREGVPHRLPRLRVHDEAQIAEADVVVTRWMVRGTHDGELMGIPPTGKHVTLTGIVMDRLVDGKLVETWLQADVLGMLQQLGAMPTSAQAAA